MQYSEKEEISHFEGNALRNFKKLFNSGIAQKILNYCRHTDTKPLKIPIRNGNPEDAYVLITSVAEQNWRKRLEANNTLPKGHTKSPKLGSRNYAFSKGVSPTEVANYFSLERDGVTVFPEGANLFAEYAQENMDKLQLPGLYDIL
jgi:hypothetical protein